MIKRVRIDKEIK